MCEIPPSGFGRIAYERWREGTGIPLDFTWGRLPHITQAVWERVAQAVLAEYEAATRERAGDAR